MKKLYQITALIFILSSFITSKAQSGLNPDSVLYKKSWEVGIRLRSDGFGVGAEFTKQKIFKRSLLFQVQFGYFRHPKQVRQASLYGGNGLFGSDGFKPYVFGKQHTLFTLYGGIGQKFLLAEKGKRHGVQLFFKYAGGLSIAFLKPYLLQVRDSSFQTLDYVDTQYDPNNTDNGFLDITRILGASGFGKGWKFKVLPALHVEVGMEFDWAKNESFIKCLEIGVASDFYYTRVPVMVQDNKFLFPSVYAGFLLGKRKER